MIGDTRDYVKLVPMVKNQKMLDVSKSSFLLGCLVLMLIFRRCRQVNLFWEQVRRERMVARISMTIRRFALVTMSPKETCVMLSKMVAAKASEM